MPCGLPEEEGGPPFQRAQDERSMANKRKDEAMEGTGIMLKTFGRVFALCALLLAAAVAEAEPLDAFKDLEGTLDIAGGTAHIPVMTQAAQDIMTFNPKVRITVAGGGSGVGVKQVGEGLVGIGNTGRPLKEKEVEQYGLKTYPFAIDGVRWRFTRTTPSRA